MISGLDSGATGSGSRDAGALSDEKTLIDLGLVPGKAESMMPRVNDISLRMTIDSNPIVIKVNLSHSMH